MTRTTYALAAVLAAAVCLLLGLYLGRSDERASAPMRAWREDDDGIQPADPWTVATMRSADGTQFTWTYA